MFSLYVRRDWHGAPNSTLAASQSNYLARAFDFAERYTKGEEKVCVLEWM